MPVGRCANSAGANSPFEFVPEAGFEPARREAMDFETTAFASYATRASLGMVGGRSTTRLTRVCNLPGRGWVLGPTPTEESPDVARFHLPRPGVATPWHGTTVARPRIVGVGWRGVGGSRP